MEFQPDFNTFLVLSGIGLLASVFLGLGTAIHKGFILISWGILALTGPVFHSAIGNLLESKVLEGEAVSDAHSVTLYTLAYVFPIVLIIGSVAWIWAGPREEVKEA